MDGLSWPLHRLLSEPGVVLIEGQSEKSAPWNFSNTGHLVLILFMLLILQSVPSNFINTVNTLLVLLIFYEYYESLSFIHTVDKVIVL